MQQSRPKEQVRRSTGTTDEKLAKRKQHQITQNIYAEFDKALNRDPFVDCGFNSPSQQAG